jgi:hypothetical protein
VIVEHNCKTDDLETISSESSKDLTMISNEMYSEMQFGELVSLSLQMMLPPPLHEKHPQILSSIGAARNRNIDDTSGQYSEKVPGGMNNKKDDIYEFIYISFYSPSLVPLITISFTSMFCISKITSTKQDERINTTIHHILIK